MIRPKDADRIAKSVDPDQTAPRGAVLSGSALFAQTYLSENLGSLQYMHSYIPFQIDHDFSVFCLRDVKTNQL